MLRIHSLKIQEDLSNLEILDRALIFSGIRKADVVDWKIIKKSIDARKKNDVHYLYTLDIKVKDERKYHKKSYQKIDTIKEISIPTIQVSRTCKKQPVIIGAGPSGLFAALILIQNGLKPIILEQGKTVEEREKDVNSFIQTGNLNPFSNIQFGEGGAGTFSDGKLTTGISSPYCQKVLREFVNFGAPEQILYLAKPHMGTDNLIHIIKNMRKYMINQGATFHFNTKAIDFEIENNALTHVVGKNIKNNSTFTIETDSVILAIGHSSHDTFYTLHEKGLLLEPKNFSVGVRIEHLQKDINLAQYGNISKLKLPPAEYKLAYHSPTGRSCYTFCMCPGGTVMASSSEKNTIVTNGMSKFLREGINANSALLVNVTPNDFVRDDLPSFASGIEFQKDLEQKAFILGGSNYHAPIQRVEDFLNNKPSSKIGTIKPTYLPGVTTTNLHEILPDFVSTTLQEGIKYFDTKLKGFANPDSILTGLETRSSSPVRIIRNEQLMAPIHGFYPCGEGAGYAGGIMSAAVDGIKCAISLLQN